MTHPRLPKRMADAGITSRRSRFLVRLFIAVALCVAGHVGAAAPDLTAGGVPNDTEQWNLGPTGMTGWCYREGQLTTNARQFQVKSVATGSPAAGIMLVNDVILGASGTGADPVNFTQDARIAFAQAIGEAEAQSPATLKILRWRAGVTSIVSLTLETLGAYSATAPYNCPKSAAILEKGIQWMMNTNANDNNWRYSALTLLAANDPNNPNNAARQAKAAADARQLILTPSQIALFTSGKSMGKNAKPWHIGPQLIALSEYYLRTGDPDVLPSIRAYAHCAANGQSFLGTCGHFFTDPGFRNASVNGPYNIGYGPINNAAIPCYIGLVLAKKCGLNDPEITAGIERAGTFYAQYTHLGCAGYGEHLAYEGHDTNGKAGLQALAFQLEGNRLESTKYYARASTAAAIAERDIGHTGSFFAFLYAPLGANVGGPDAMAYYFRETKWMYELARRWDGSFVYNSFSGGGVEIDALSGPAGCLMATPMLLTYALPLRQTYLTGKDQNPANWITPAEIPEVQAASAHIYNAPGRTTPELLTDLGSWSPKVRRYAARELKKRTADYATVLPLIHAMATNEAGSFQSRNGACAALGEIGDTTSVPVLLPLVTNANFVVRYGASSALAGYQASGNGVDLKPHVTALMQACIANAKPLLPLDPVDPMQTVNGNLCSALFAAHAALYTHDLVGVDRTLLYDAMRVCAANAQAGVRNGLSTIYPKLTQTDIEQLGDVFVNIAYENAPAGMGVTGAREPAMSFLQSKGKAEGVPLAIRFAEDIGYDGGGIVNPLGVLADYARSSQSVTPNPDVSHFCEVLIASGAKYGIPEAQAVLDAIAADLSPDILTYFKRIDWIIPDDATFNLPKKWTVLRVHSKNNSNPTSTYTWRKLRGAGAVSFSPNGTSAAKDATVVFDGTPGEYLFEVTMSDSHGLTEVSKTVAVTLRTSGGTLPSNSPPTANGQSLVAAQGTPTQVILTGSDPEGYPLTYTVTNGPTHGYLSGTAPHLVYTAAANYTGADSLTFQVEDSEGQTATATVNITVGAAGAIGLALYEPFNYAAGNLQGKSGASEIGLTGTWTAGSQLTTEAPSLSYGTLPTSGNRVKSVGMNSPGGSRPISTAALANRGLLDNGATLWFSVVMSGYGGYDASGNVFHLALGNGGIFYTFPNIYTIPDDGSIPGSGLGVKLQNKGVYAAQFSATSAPLIGNYDNTVTGGIINDNPRLVVGKITWGATSDTIEIYLPEQDMILPAPTSLLTANVDQATFDTLTFSRGSNVLLDEIRFGATLQSVLQGTAEMSADVTAPTPNPMTFAVAPAPVSSSSITMTAAPAFDSMGVEYYFTCTAGGGNDSGWQTSNVYTDSGLTPGVAYSYTVKARDQHPALNETAPSVAASATIPALGTVPGVEGLPESLAQSLITNAALTVGTVTQSGAYSMTVPAGHVLSQSPADGAPVAYGSAVNLVISIGQDTALPILTPVNIVDDRSGETVELGTPVTYTLTFSKDIDAATLDAGDFINVGDAPITLGTITETSPGVVTVTVTPNGTVAGILRFAVAAGTVIEDTLGNDLNTASAIIDDTVITVTPEQPDTQIFTGNNSSGTTDNWSTSLNWNVNTGPVPSGNDNVIISANKQVMVNLNPTAIYSGNLTLADGAHLQAGNGINNVSVYNCLGTPGTTTISMADGSRISFRDNNSPVMPAIVLQGNAEITTGSSSSPGAHPIFGFPITGPYALTLSGKSPNTTNLNVANNFGHLILSTQYGTLFTVNANMAGSLGGNVTIGADYNTGSKGANLIVTAANAMSDTATLSLYGNTGTLVTFNANDTIGGVKLNGVKQLPGTYTSSNATWLAGTGTLTVTGAVMAYWNPSGGPSGTWDDSNIWNTQADLAGTNNAWAPGQIASFNPTGTYDVTLSGTKEIGGLVVSNGSVTLSAGGLSLSSDAPVNVASGATLAINTVIEQNSLGLGLHKSGAGLLTLSSENTFTGPVAIGAGTLSIATIDNAGAPSALGQYPTADPDGLFLAGGTLRYTGGNATVNRGFTFTGTSTIEVVNAGSGLSLGDVETGGPGTLTVTGGAGSSLGLGNIKIIQGNNITLNPIVTSMTVASVEGYSAYPIAATITLSGSSTGNVVTGSISASVYPGSAYQQGTGVVKTGTGDWRLAGAITAGPVANNNVTVNDGTLILAGNNTFTGYTNLNNLAKLVLDYTATNTSKIGTIFLNGGTLELRGGSHIEDVGSTTLNAGPTVFITRNGGTARLRMNAITRNAQSSISFLDGTVADTDRTNTNGILGGYATVGTDWAVNSTNGTDGAITALSSFATWTTSGGSATANYLLNGSDALTGALAANSLKIANSTFNDTLNLGANALTITSTSATAIGGVLYAGEGFDRYTISGSAGLLASSTTGELIVHTVDGTLTVNAPIVTTGATAGVLTKSGNGSLILGGSNVYTGTTRVNSGKLFVNGSLSNVGANLQVDPGATLGGSGTVGRNITIANGGKLEFNISAPAGSHVPLTRSTSRTLAFSGTSVLTITSNSGSAPGLYTLITGGNNITGSAPATVILPPGWTADPPVISGNMLRINITTVVNPPNALPVWSSNPLNEINASEDAAYSASLANNASDFNSDPLTFTKVSGPAWLSVAANGALSGTPDNSNIGPNTFTISVSDGIAAPVEVALNITVINTNDAPLWSSNPLVGPNATEDAAYSQNMATAASDVDPGAVLTFAKTSGPSWLNVAANGTISGTPTNSNVGLNTFTVSVSDGIAAPVETTVQISVINVNDAPVWSGNPIAGANAIEDIAYIGTLAGNATDVDAGASLTFTKFSGPSWLSVASNGALSGLPLNSDVGVNTFSVRVSDGIAAVATTTLVITVINTNDAPLAQAQSVTTEQESAVPVTLVGTDVDLSDTLTYSIVAQPAHGTLSGTAPNLTYTPTSGYNGPDSFTFKINDGTVDSAVATVSITVTVLNDPPVATAQSVTTDEDTALPITLTGTDPDNNPLTFTIVTQPTKGTMSGTAPNVTYTPNANSNGADSFTFKANDGLEDSAVATVSITVTPVNDVPVFTVTPIVLASGTELVAYSGQTLAGKATDVDAGDTLTYSKISGPSWLTVATNGTLTGTPPLGTEGLNSFVVRATDSASASVDATLQITVSIAGLTWDANGTTTGQTNGAGAWLGANLWWTGVANSNWVAGSNALFGGPSTSAGAVTLASPTSVGKIAFYTFTSTYTLGTAGQTITINDNVSTTANSGAVSIISPLVLGANQTWTNNSVSAITASSTFDNGGYTVTVGGTGTITMSGVISGAGGFVKNGTNRLSFGASSNANTYTGATTVNSGVLAIANHSGSLGGGNLTLNSGVVTFYWGSGLTRTLGSGSNQVQILGGDSGFGGDASTGPTINLGTTVVWGASGEGTATGYFNPSKFVLGSPDTANPGATTVFSTGINFNGTTRTILVPKGLNATSGNVATISAAISSTGTAGLIKEGDGTLALSASNTYTGPTTISAGTLRIGSNSAGSLNNGSYSENIITASGTALQIWSSANQTLSGTISGGASLSKAYGGTLTLSNSNTYTGKTSLLPQNTTGFTVNITSFNSVNGGTPTMASSSLGAPTTIANGTIDIGDGGKQAGVNLIYTGPGETTDRVINFGFNGSASQTLTASGSGLLKFTSAMTANTITSQSGALILTGTGSGEITQALPALPSGGLTKNGAGTWTLGGTNIYTGPTTISAGKLALGASNVLPNASAVSIGAATLDAVTFSDTLGTLDTTATAVINLGSGATLAFADSSAIDWTGGTLNITGTFVPGASLRFGTSSTGLTSTQLTKITVAGYSNFLLDANGYLTVDTTPPTLASSAIVDDKAGAPINPNTLVTYTLTFSEDMDATSVSAADFGNAGTATITIGTISEISPGVFTILVTPTTAGTLQFKVNATAMLKDVVGNNLNTTAAILDNTTLTVQTPFASWASGAASTADANNDGVANGVAWVLGTTNATANATALLPTFDNTSDPDYFIYTYRRNDAANSDPNTTITVKYGSDLGTWTTAVHDNSGNANIIITPTNDGAGAGVDLVQVKIKRTLAVGGKLFARLNVVIAP